MRQPRNNENIEAKSRLSKTAGTSVLIGGLISMACLIYCLFQGSKELEGAERVAFFLPYAIPFGIATIAFGVLGMLSITADKEKPRYRLSGISAIAGGAVFIAEALVLGIGLSAWDFCISLAVIGFFIAAMGVVNLIPSSE